MSTAPNDEPTFWEKGVEKCKRQPLVPLGMGATVIALVGAAASLRKGNRENFNRYLRVRVAAQAITIVAAIAGFYLMTEKPQDAQENRVRARSGQLPIDKDSVEHLQNRYSAYNKPEPEEPPAPTKEEPVEEAAKPTQNYPGKGEKTKVSFARTRVSQAMRDSEKGLEPVEKTRMTEFQKRLEKAEELDKA